MRLLEMPQEEFSKVLDSVLKLEHPYSNRVHQNLDPISEENAIQAAVLVLFVYPKVHDGLGEMGPWILLTRRAENVVTHKGQMAFPGGHVEPEDLESPITTALRETYEEVGITGDSVSVRGILPSLLTATGFLIHPVVGVSKLSREEISLQLDAHEIAEAVWVPLRVLFHSDTYRSESISVGSIQYPIDVYQVDQHRIWGATGSILKNLLDRLRTLS